MKCSLAKTPDRKNKTTIGLPRNTGPRSSTATSPLTGHTTLQRSLRQQEIQEAPRAKFKCLRLTSPGHPSRIEKANTRCALRKRRALRRFPCPSLLALAVRLSAPPFALARRPALVDNLSSLEELQRHASFAATPMVRFGGQGISVASYSPLLLSPFVPKAPAHVKGRCCPGVGSRQYIRGETD